MAPSGGDLEGLHHEPARLGLSAMPEPGAVPLSGEALPSQAGPRGEMRLALAVLADADFPPRLFRWEAEQWIESRSRAPLFSFENICSTLSLDANSLRGQIRRWRARQHHESTPQSSRSLRVGERSRVLPGGVPAMSGSSKRRRRLQFRG